MSSVHFWMFCVRVCLWNEKFQIKPSIYCLILSTLCVSCDVDLSKAIFKIANFKIMISILRSTYKQRCSGIYSWFYFQGSKSVRGLPWQPFESTFGSLRILWRSRRRYRCEAQKRGLGKKWSILTFFAFFSTLQIHFAAHWLKDYEHDQSMNTFGVVFSLKINIQLV